MNHFLPKSVSSLKGGQYPVYLIRPINPYLSYYPNCPINVRNASFVIYNEQPFIVTRAYKSHYASDEYSNLGWLLKEEIRLISAINLARSIGAYSFFLDRFPIPITYDQVSHFLKSPRGPFHEHIQSIIEIALPKFVEYKEPTERPFINGESYAPIWGQFSVKQIYNNISLEHDILLRCLSCWIKSSMLLRYFHFHEEACALVYFALDGFIKLFLEELQEVVPKSSVKDVFHYLVEKYSIPAGYADYLAECYEKRTIYVHPYNDYGCFWEPPLDSDDLGETWEVLQDLAWIYITGDKSRWITERDGFV